MGAGSMARGMARAFSNYLTTERDRIRQQEDQELDFQMRMIEALANRPDFDPELGGAALHDLMQLQQAKGKQGKGLLNRRDLPMSQFLSGVMGGQTPMYSQYETTQTELPSVQRGGYTNPAPGFTGESVLEAPVPVPPPTMPVPGTAKNLNSAAQQLQTQQALNPPQLGGMRQFTKPGKTQRRKVKQGVLRSPEEMAQMEGQAQGARAGAVRGAQNQADIDMWREMGLDDEQIQQMLLYGGKLPTPERRAVDRFQTMVAIMPDGTQIDYQENSADGTTWLPPRVDPVTGEFIRVPFEVPVEAVRKSIGPAYQNRFQEDDRGRVTGAAYNTFVPQTAPIPIDVPPGMQGRTSPAGPATQFAGPNGEPQLGRFDRTGTNINPATIPGEGGGRVNAVRPPTAAQSGEITQQQTALRTLDTIKRLFRNDLVGPATGVFNEAREWIPLVGSDPDWQALNSAVSHYNNAIINALSGTAVSGAEAIRMRAELPTMYQHPETFVARVRQQEANIKSIVTAYMSKGLPIPQDLIDAAEALGIQTPTGIPMPPQDQQMGAGVGGFRGGFAPTVEVTGLETGAPQGTNPPAQQGERRRFGDRIGVWNGSAWVAED